MAQRKPRKSAREVAARETVRARRAEHWERERQLEDLATDYEVAAQEIEDVTTAAEERIAAYANRIRSDAEIAKQGLRDQQAESVGQMLKLDGVRSVADRLDEPVETVRKVAAARPGSAQEAGTPDHGPAVAQSTGRQSATAQPVTDPTTLANVAATASSGPVPSMPAEQRAASA
ncbi:hypothetical protein ABZU94_29020 [Streptomyces mirabilis]|uniref:hypothetical protein n=1 Tax=Streptomyces sp. NPDC005388 TaxID=3156717 RepID=UPI0033B8A3D1